jgi:hypothetical protein
LRTFEINIQQILHVTRGGDQLAKDKKKKKDKDSPSNEGTDAESPKSPSIRKREKIIDAASTSTISDPDNNNNSKDKTTKKKKKVDSLHLLPAIVVACCLAHMARFIREGIFSQIHKIRRRGKEITNVTEALNIIDDGG